MKSIAAALSALRKMASIDPELLCASLGWKIRELGLPGRPREWVLDHLPLELVRGSARPTSIPQWPDPPAAWCLVSVDVAPDVHVYPPDVEALIQDLPLLWMPTHASHSDGPRITGFDYALEVPAGNLFLQFRLPRDETSAMNRASLEKKIEAVVEGGGRARERLASFGVNTRPPTKGFKPSFTLRSMRAWAKSGEPWKD